MNVAAVEDQQIVRAVNSQSMWNYIRGNVLRSRDVSKNILTARG
jgi:hypothetical protein